MKYVNKKALGVCPNLVLSASLWKLKLMQPCFRNIPASKFSTWEAKVIYVASGLEAIETVGLTTNKIFRNWFQLYLIFKSADVDFAEQCTVQFQIRIASYYIC